ncbi:hypothetical protein [Thiorhodospira sibirica]|uniref:hypothetical protein n=1 Tax=Thiorhodospira sibirica TaxID=154347 RepID=UPI00022C5DA2|nr:hypothetical protein [Thiorhodospira sibirica]
MSRLTGSSLSEHLLNSLGVNLNALLQTTFSNKLQNMINAQQDSNLALAAVFMQSSDVRAAVNGLITALSAEIAATKAQLGEEPGGWRLHYAQDGSSAQTLSGQTGVQDLFILNYLFDERNGGFSSFGQVTINNYRQADGDRIVFIDQSNTQGIDITQFSNYVEPQEGNARILFNPSPDNPPQPEQWLQIMGAASPPFGGTPKDIEGVEFVLLTQQQIELTGIEPALGL